MRVVMNLHFSLINPDPGTNGTGIKLFLWPICIHLSQSCGVTEPITIVDRNASCSQFWEIGNKCGYIFVLRFAFFHRYYSFLYNNFSIMNVRYSETNAYYSLDSQIDFCEADIFGKLSKGADRDLTALSSR